MAAQKHHKIFQLVLDHGADPNKCENILKLAFELEDADIIRIILRDGRVDPTAHQYRTIIMAIKDDVEIECIQLVLADQRIDINDVFRKIIDNPSLSPGYVASILKFHPTFDPASWDNYAIRRLSSHKGLRVDGDVQDLLREADVDPSACDNYAIRKASKIGNFGIIRGLLTDKRVDPCARNNEALKGACKIGSAPSVYELLKDSRVDPSIDNLHVTLLEIAIKNYHSEVIIELLCDERVDPSVPDNYPILLAIRMDQVEAIIILLDDERVDPGCNNNECLRVACENRCYDAVRLLLADERVDPTTNNYEILRTALENMDFELMDLLSEDDRLSSYSRADSSPCRKKLKISPEARVQ
ncbi:hypothetical protein AKO1_002186 [Acrasis kona]|uniref:Ankyrin repeat protein n=1 Tax=Acrasis kona TaxID=1008807 RepID=A0AAW2YP07_9EUKA